MPNLSPQIHPNTFKSKYIHIRGGAQYSDDEETSSDEESENATEYDFADDIDGDSDFDESFDDSSLLPRLLHHYHTTPPLTKLYLTSSFIISTLSFLLNQNRFPSILTLHYPSLLTGQLWRPVTQFMNLGPLSLSYFLTLQFLWTYMSSIEKLLHTTPTTFINLLVMIPTLMVVSYGVLGLNVDLLGHNFSTFLVYLWSRLHEGMEVNLMELFTLRAEVLPWFFLGQTFLLEGQLPTLDFLGIVFGHIFYHRYMDGGVKGEWLDKWYYNSGGFWKWLREEYEKVGEEFRGV
ncbi:hypothetical protein TrVE_jg7455 [Triparma verrucosa]|uniref:Derlin n=2 Tax=Triparma TaxID=722752 RepID=A0A9W7AJZ8_9STRA|nr:hypothetical protein TrST_g7190 [Triparma strigata]GMI04378.1 hypothetical protein TrVE_jg7455 [Triparma verrucosa]